MQTLSLYPSTNGRPTKAYRQVGFAGTPSRPLGGQTGVDRSSVCIATSLVSPTLTQRSITLTMTGSTTHTKIYGCVGGKPTWGTSAVQNVSKSSRYKGVGWHKSIGKWQAYIKVNQTIQYLGCFSSERLAAFSYNQAAKREFGEFAFLNKIENPPRALLRF